jgi:hypothetical protein
VIVEAAVFVVDDDQQRTVPLRAGRQRVVGGEKRSWPSLTSAGGWSSLTGKPSGLKLVNAGSSQDTGGSVPAAASSRKLGSFWLQVRSRMVCHGRPVLLK